MKKLLLIIAIIVALLAILLYIIQYIFESNSFNHYAHPEEYGKFPSDFGVEYEEVYFKSTNNVNIHGWWLQHSKNAPTLIYSHGNADSIETRSLLLTVLYKQLKCNVLAYDYRGYGKSNPGMRTTYQGTSDDADAALAFVKEKMKNGFGTKIYAYGHSLGGGITTDLVRRHPNDFQLLILENTLLSLRKQVKKIAKDNKIPMLSIFCKDVYNNERNIQNITIPTVIIVGDKDDFVPHQNSEKLFEISAAKQKIIVHNPDGEHKADWEKDVHTICDPINEFITTHNLR
ncbi:putative Alpha/Beta hydrolase protein [Blattamonas nauphoetae]|uniref:Alpha/Beta hydrolase protein n=1 Tax=Blattamonas nauphoetae TaxID=2049346 RepID=A0ABQ9Y3G6_9EUKA|nr:putative Alpha/Beta hydrolase protein [Blattamonas nauphoetae]